MKLFIFVVLAFSVGSHTIAQTAMFKWDDGACDQEGTFLTSKYSRKQIEDTYKLSQQSYFILSTAPLIDPAQLKEINISMLDAEFKTKLAELKALDVVRVPYWLNLKARELQELQNMYKLDRIAITAMTDPEVLRQYPQKDPVVQKYTNALVAGGRELFAVWEELNIQRRAWNCCPERMKEKFARESASPDKELYARMEVVNFGWYNCVNQTIPHASYRLAEDNFRKLFIKITAHNCVEP